MCIFVVVFSFVVYISVSNLTTPVARKLIVYVNPFSGSGKAMKIYEKYVKPMFAEAEIQHQLVKTGWILKS